MGRVVVALLALVLTACADSGNGAQPTSEPSSSPATNSASPETQAPKLAPPKVRFAEAVAALRRSDPLEYNYVLEDTHIAVIQSFGSWDPAAHSASLNVFVSNPVDPADPDIGGRILVIGEEWYLQQLNRCWAPVDRDFAAEQYGLTEETLGLTTADVLRQAQVTGTSPGSEEVLEVDFEASSVLAMSGLTDIDAGGIRVPGEVTVLDGRVTKFTIGGADMAEALAGEVSPKGAKDLSYFALEMSFTHGRTQSIRRPPPDKLAPDATTPCPAADKTTA